MPPRKRALSDDHTASEGDGEGSLCGICHEVIKEQGVMRTGRTRTCVHQLCYPCIDKWLRRSSSCPICRKRCTLLEKVRVADNKKIGKGRKITRRDYVDSSDSEEGGGGGALPSSDDEWEVCCVCGSCDNILVMCDGCDCLQHTYCRIPAIPDNPLPEKYFCPDCESRKRPQDSKDSKDRKDSKEAKKDSTAQPPRQRPRLPPAEMKTLYTTRCILRADELSNSEESFLAAVSRHLQLDRAVGVRGTHEAATTRKPHPTAGVEKAIPALVNYTSQTVQQRLHSMVASFPWMCRACTLINTGVSCEACGSSSLSPLHAASDTPPAVPVASSTPPQESTTAPCAHCPVCNTVFPRGVSAETMHQHVNSHFS